MHIIFNVESVALKKSKSLCFASKEKFLKSDGVKSNDEKMMKSNDGVSSPHGSENEVRYFLGDSLNKNIPSIKMLGNLIKKESTLRCFEKKVLLKHIKAAINKCFLK